MLIQRNVNYILKLGASMENVKHQGWNNVKGDTHYLAVQAAKNAPENLPPPRQTADVREDLAGQVLRVNALHANLEAALADILKLEQH